MSDTVYIHYGSDKFDPEKFQKIKNRQIPWNKPERGTGLWASRVDAKYGWKDWCENAEFGLDRLSSSFTFTLKPDADVYYISTDLDVLILPNHLTDEFDWYTAKSINFELCRDELGIDAIEVLDIDPVYMDLYGWDCDSILILNPDVIVSE